MTRFTPLARVFYTHLDTLALTLGPSSIERYGCITQRFLVYLQQSFPHLRHVSQLRRDPHILGWLRAIRNEQPPLSTKTRFGYIGGLRRLLEGLAAEGHALHPNLIRPEDFPPLPHYLPRPLSPQEDQLLQQQLHRADDLPANAVLLMRATGIRISECIHLKLDCLRQLGPQQWAIHVPLGKLHTERLVPADAEVQRLVARLLDLRTLAPPAKLARSQSFLLPRLGGRYSLRGTLRTALAKAAQRAGCAPPVTPHRLRHTYATEMLRLGVSLPALMQLLGHKCIHMTLRYTQVTQPDLQREYQRARQTASQSYHLLTPALIASAAQADLPGIQQALAAARHLFHLYRCQLPNDKIRRQLERLDQRLRRIALQLDRITRTEK